MTYRLEFHLGPVQKFIGEARRTRDYWAGSFLLSWLVGQAMVSVLDNGGKILLPQIDHGAPGDGGTRRADPTITAIMAAAGKGDGSQAQPFLGSLTNHFLAQIDDREAGAKAASAIRAKWVDLADAVREHLLGNFEFLSEDSFFRTGSSNSPDSYDPIEESIASWNAQIGTIDKTPFWDIFWIVNQVKNAWETDIAGVTSLIDLRKGYRLCADFQESRNGSSLCTMMTGLADISGRCHAAADPAERAAHRAYWQAFRKHLNNVRYGDRELDDAAASLDLRANESLSAPALVKRLFPLLVLQMEDEVKKTIGWVPTVRASSALLTKIAERHDRRLLGIIPVSTIRQTDQASSDDDSVTEKARQDPLYWPSTSYMAAAHWLSRVCRSQPDLAGEFTAQIASMSRKYEVAEASLWLKCLHEEISHPFLAVDGALFHENRLERADIPANKKAARAAQREALKLLGRIYGAEWQLPEGARRSAFDRAAKPSIGRPPSYYALVKVDGDKVGKSLDGADIETKQAISRLFNDFARDLRGSSEVDTGRIYDRNGIVMYAGADECLVMCPPEDAIDLALEIKGAFDDAQSAAIAKLEESGSGEEQIQAIEKLTVSGAVVFIDIRSPLRWAVSEIGQYLDGVVKDAVGRNALGMAIVELEGRRAEWVAPWPNPKTHGSLDSFRFLLREAICSDPIIGSNFLFHKLGAVLTPFIVTADDGEKGGLKRSDRSIVDHDGFIAKALINVVVAQSLIDASRHEEISSAIFDVTRSVRRTFLLRKEAALPYQAGRYSMSGLDILRLIVDNWCKDDVRTFESAIAAERAA